MAEERLRAREDMQTCEESEDHSDTTDAVTVKKDLDNLDKDRDSSLYGPTMAA